MARKSNLPVHAPSSCYNAAAEQQQNYIGQQILAARNRAKLSLAKFSKLLEQYGVCVSAAALSKWELGKSVPSAYQLLAVSRALHIADCVSYFSSAGDIPELNEEGLRKVEEYKTDLIASGRYKPYPSTNNILQFIEMPVSRLTASAGSGAFLDEGNFELVRFPASSVPTGAHFGLRVSGDSMEPVYHDGQIVWVQRCEQLNVGEVGIFVYDGEGYIKVYGEQEPEESCRESFIDSYGAVHMQPVLISYNAMYAPRPISPHTGFQIVGRVL